MELVRQNDPLRRENAALQATARSFRVELKQVERRQHRQAAPFSKDRAVAQPKRSGRQPGAGAFRHREAFMLAAEPEPLIVVPMEAISCAHCGGELVGERLDEAAVADLPERPPVEVRRYRVAVHRCQPCGRRNRGQHPDLAPGAMGSHGASLGPTPAAPTHTLHYEARGCPSARFRPSWRT